MFADDTTLYATDDDLSKLNGSFLKKLEKLFEWCSANKLDTNWSIFYVCNLFYVCNK